MEIIFYRVCYEKLIVIDCKSKKAAKKALARENKLCKKMGLLSGKKPFIKKVKLKLPNLEYREYISNIGKLKLFMDTRVEEYENKDGEIVFILQGNEVLRLDLNCLNIQMLRHSINIVSIQKKNIIGEVI